MSGISADSLRVAYEDRIIVDGLDIDVPKGKITCVIGPNGCGKSTLLKSLGRILKPVGGSVYLDGSDIRNLSAREIARRMAVLPQTPQSPSGLTVSELVSFGRFPHRSGFGKPTAEDGGIIRWALEVTKLTGFDDEPVDNLSGGQRQRVWIAMALAQQTELILLDEPTTYLDMSYQLEVLELLYSLNREQGRTVAMVLHDLNLAARFSDYMVALCGGTVVKHGTPEEVITPEVLRTAFSVDAVIAKDPKSGKPVCVSYDLIRQREGES